MPTGKNVCRGCSKAGFETTFTPSISFAVIDFGQKKACEMQQPDMVP